MRKLPDGSIVNSYFHVKKSDTGADVKNQGMRTVLGQVDKIHYIDDQTNVSKKFVEYDVIIRDERGGQSTLKNVRHESTLGGTNDYDETVLEANEVAFSGKLEAGNLFSNKNGTLVYVSFRDGSFDKPYIEGTVMHPKKLGAKRSEGIRKLGEFRGVEWNINAKGELIITYRGNRSADGKLIRPATGPTVIKIDEQGVFTITDNEDQKVEVNRTNRTISFSNGVTVTVDGANDKFTVQTSAGAKAIVDGSNDTVHLTDNGTGALKISGEKVALGASSAELLQQISDQLQELITLFTTVANHTHIGNLGYPTSVPDTQAAWQTAASNLTSIKGLVDGIKGTL